MKIVHNVCHHPPFVFQISDTDKIVVCCLEMSGKTIKNSHANLQSCVKEMCQAAVKNQCKVMSTFHAEIIILFIIFAVLLYCMCHSLVFCLCLQTKRIGLFVSTFVHLVLVHFCISFFFLQANKERDLLQHLFTKYISWPVVSSIIVESAARFGENLEGRLLDPRSAINFLLSQGTVTSSYKFHGFNID